jgi:hypothetical protein
VRVGGVVQPLIGQRQPLAPVAPPAQFVDTRPPQPGVRVVETSLQQRPQPAPPPSRGLSVRGQPSEGQAPAPAPQPAPSPPPAANAAAPEGQGAKPDKPEGSGDDASARFSLLELD